MQRIIIEQMGIVKSSERWEDEFELLFQQHHPTCKKIRHRTTSAKYDLFTLPILSPQHHLELTTRLTNRQQRPSSHLLPLIRCFHTSEDNYCGSRDQLDLIYEESTPSLEQFLSYRRTKHEGFSTEEILCVVRAVALGLRELKEMGEEHGSVLPANVVVNGSVKLRDRIIIEEEQRNDEIRANSQKRVKGFPSPQKLYTYFDTLTHFEEFTADLFSLGILALQLIHPHHNMQSLYYAPTPAHNIKLDVDRLQQFKDTVAAPQLREAVYILTDPLTNPRIKIYSVLKGWSIDESNLKLLKENPFVMEQSNEEKGHVTLIEELAQSQADREGTGRNEKVWDTSNVVSAKLGTQPPIFQSNITFAGNQPQQQQPFQPAYKSQFTPQFQYPTQINAPIISIPSNKFNSTTASTMPAYIPPQSYSYAPPTFKINSTPSYPLLTQTAPVKYVQSAYKPLTDFSKPLFDYNKPLPEVSRPLPLTNPTTNYHNLFADTKSIIFPEAPKLQVSPQPTVDPVTNNSSPPLQSIDSVGSQLLQPLEFTKIESIYHEEVRPPLEAEPQLKLAVANSLEVEADNDAPAPLSETENNNATIGEVTEHDNSNQESELIVEQYQIGTKYQGYKKYGKRNGRGKFYYKEGSYYDGEWKDNKMDGFGILYYPNGSVAYEGDWKDDEFHGKGVVYNDHPAPLNTVFDFTNFHKLEEEWVKYEGELRNDCKQGIGRLTLTNGQTYEGQFLKDLIHGEGVFTRVNGTSIRGCWTESLLKKLYN